MMVRCDLCGLPILRYGVATEDANVHVRCFKRAIMKGWEEQIKENTVRSSEME